MIADSGIKKGKKIDARCNANRWQNFLKIALFSTCPLFFVRQPDDRTSSSLGPSSEVSPDDYRNFQVVSVLVARRSTFANSVVGNYLFQALFVRGCVYISFPLIMYSRVLTKPWRRGACRVVPVFYRTDTFIKYLRSYFFLSPRSGRLRFDSGRPYGPPVDRLHGGRIHRRKGRNV